MKTNECGAGFGTIGKERSKLLASAIAVIMLVSAVAFYSDNDVSADSWDGYSATEFTEAPTEISSAADLKGFANWVNEGNGTSDLAVELTADIDLGGHVWVPIGLSYRNGSSVTESSHPFEGTFDGNGYAITGLNVENGAYTDNADGNEVTLGLFGALNGGTVKNLIVGGNVSGYDATGMIAGYMYGSSSIDNCFTTSDSKVSGGDNTGGIVGKIYGGTITDSSNYADVTSTGTQINQSNQAKAGGIVAHADARTNSITISNVSNHGDITTQDSLRGGIIGMVQASGSITVSNGTDFESGDAIGSYPTHDNVNISNVGTTSERYSGVNVTATAFIGTVDGVGMNNSLIFLNGTEVRVEYGVTDGWTRIITADGDLICHADLSRYAVYGGSSGADVDKSSITVNGGVLSAVAGGGYHDATVNEATIVVNDGVFSFGVAGGGESSTSHSVDDISDMSSYNCTSKVNITINGGTFTCAVAGGLFSYAYVGETSMTITGGTFNEIIAGGINGYTSTSKVTIDAADGSTINAGLITTANRGEVNSADIDIIDMGVGGKAIIIAVGSLAGTTSTDGGPNGTVDEVNLDISSTIEVVSGVYMGGAQWGEGKHNPWDSETENALIKANLTINAPGRTISGNDIVPDAEYNANGGQYGIGEYEKYTHFVPNGVDYTIGAGKTWTITAGILGILEGNKITFNAGATFNGAVAGPDGIPVILNNVVAGESGLTISIGSIVIEGVGSGTMTFSEGSEVEGTNSGINYIFEGDVTFNNFTQGTGTLTFQDEEGNTYTDVTEAMEAGVGITLGSNTTLTDLPFSTGDMVLEFGYDGQIHTPATGIPFVANAGFAIQSAYISGGNCVTGQIPNMVAVGQTEAGTYTIQYTITITDSDGDNSHTYTPTIVWTIEPQTVDVEFDNISKEYDGDADVDQEFTTDADGISFGDAYYTDINAGDSIEVRLPIIISEDSTATNYTFTVNGTEAVLLGDSESGYYLALQGSISKKEITVDIIVSQEYDGDVFDHTYVDPNVTEVDGDVFSVTVTTNGSDADTYTGADLTYGGYSITNNDVDVSSNYTVVYGSGNALTIDQKKITASPATGAVITKVYNGWSSRTMSAGDFQLIGAITGDDVTVAWTPGANYIKYNSPNVLEAHTLTVAGVYLEGTDADNYRLESDTVVFEDGDGITVGITPMVLSFSEGSSIDIQKKYDESNVVPEGQISADDFSVSTAQNGAFPTVTVTSAVYNTTDAGENLTVYVTGVEWIDNGTYLASNFTLPEPQTAGGVQYYFTITGQNVKITPITIDSTKIHHDLEEQDGQIVLTLSVSYGDIETTGFTSVLTSNNTPVQGTGNSYVINGAGTYSATVTMTDPNWYGSVTVSIPVEFDYTANFYTQAVYGTYIEQPEQSVSGSASIQTPSATNVPEGYVLVGWALEPNGPKVYSVNVFVDVSPVGTNFYAVYAEDTGTTPGEPVTGPQVIINIPDEFVIGVQTEFTISTVKGGYDGDVIGTGFFEGVPGVDYYIEFQEVKDGKWYSWEGDFGPSTGFPMSDATLKLRVTFYNAGVYDLTVQIVSAEGIGTLVCEDTAVVNVPAEHSLGYYIIDALNYVYADGGEHNANAYTYAGALEATSGGVIAEYGYDYYEALLAYLQAYAEGGEDAVKDLPAEQLAKAQSVLSDYARYMGALYRNSDGGVSRVFFNGAEYAWKADDKGVYLHGSNWRDSEGNTLVSAVTQYIYTTQNTSIVMEVSNGYERQSLTYGGVFTDAPAEEPEQYIVVFNDSEGNLVDTVEGLVSGSAVLLPKTITVNGEVMAVESWTIGTDVVLSPGIGYYFVDPAHAINGTITMVAVVEEIPDPVTVTYYDGTQIIKVQVMYPGEFFEFPQVSLTDGETFDGWYSDEAFVTPAGTSLPEDATGTYALYAKVNAAPAKATYGIVFMNGDESVAYDGYTGLEEGTTVALPSTINGIDASKFRLNGWYLEGKLPMTTYTVRGVDAVDGTITLYADIVQYAFTVTQSETQNGSFTTFVQNGALLINAFPDTGFAVDMVSVIAGEESLTVVKISDTSFYVSIQSDVTVTVTFKDVSGEQDPEDVSTMVDVSIGSLSDGIQVQLDALVGILPSDFQVSVTYYYQTVSESGMTGFGYNTVSQQVSITAENSGRWNVDVDMTSATNYGSAYLGFASVTYSIDEVEYEFESVLTNIIHVPITS